MAVYGLLRLGRAARRRVRRQLAAGDRRRGAVDVSLCDRHLGHDGGADRAGRRAARDQRAVRGAARHGAAARAGAGRGSLRHDWCWPACCWCGCGRATAKGAHDDTILADAVGLTSRMQLQTQQAKGATAMASPLQLGPISIHPIVEQVTPLLDPLEFFPSLTKEVLEENRSWLQPSLPSTPPPARSCSASSPISCRRRTTHILVDTCIGNDKPRPTRPFWHQMKATASRRAGRHRRSASNDIDYVMCTHLHVDHVGWNTGSTTAAGCRPSRRPATCSPSSELAYWTQKREGGAARPGSPIRVLPIVAAKRADVVKSDHALNDMVRLVADPRPYHRPLLGASRQARRRML